MVVKSPSRQEAVVRAQAGTRSSEMHRAVSSVLPRPRYQPNTRLPWLPRKSTKGSPLEPSGASPGTPERKEVKMHDQSVRAIRKPIRLLRLPVSTLLRSAERR